MNKVIYLTKVYRSIYLWIPPADQADLLCQAMFLLHKEQFSSVFFVRAMARGGKHPMFSIQNQDDTHPKSLK